jgi:hypothetical protein
MINRFHSSRVLSATLAAALIAFSDSADASGGDGFTENMFTPEYHVPAAELPAYAHGELGVVSPTYWRVYHFLAYRALTGHALSKDELTTLDVDGWQVGKNIRPAGSPPSEAANPIEAWYKARKSVSGTRDVNVDTNTDIGDFDIILNCPMDAFDRAAKTLAQRLAQGGQQWAAVWLANQDAVFANCSPQVTQELRKKPRLERPMSMPTALPAKAPEWLAKDHAYQSAAALFYAGRYDEARERFLAIGKDAKSPWQPLGNYLAARCLLRKVSTFPSDPGKKENEKLINDLLGKARRELLDASSTYPPARQLVGWVDFRLRPDEYRVELSAMLSSTKIDRDTPQLLSDYLNLLDKLAPERMMAAGDAMTAWIGIMQASGGDPYSDRNSEEARQRRHAALELARTHWNKTHDTAWLIAVLTNAGAGDMQADEIKAASAVKEGSPGYVDVQYHLARFDIAGDKLRDADAIVSAMLKQAMPAYVRNRWLRMKMVTAQTAEEFFAAAPRVVAERDQGTPIPNEGAPEMKASVLFDDDFRTHLARNFPLATLMRLKPMIPPERQKWLDDMIWTRAVLLGDYATADALIDEVASGRDTTRNLYERYKKAKTPDEKRDAAFVILANTPELVPETSGKKSGRRYDASEYWSCGYSDAAATDNFGFIAPAFLSADEHMRADKEQELLGQIPKRSTYLIPPVVEWAKKHRDDPEAPKALHFLVASTRNECGTGADVPGGAKRNYSKEAFQVLHSLFPKSPWAAKTRYYY